MNKIMKTMFVSLALIVLGCMTAFAGPNDCPQYGQSLKHKYGSAPCVGSDHLAEGGYSQYFHATSDGYVFVSKGAPIAETAPNIQLYDDGNTIMECWICDDAGDGSWYLSTRAGLLTGLIHDSYLDKWYFLQDNGRMATQNGTYTIETITPMAGAASYEAGGPYFPFNFGTTQKNLTFDASGAITNITMGEAERGNYYYETITKTTWDNTTRQRGYAPYIFTSKMNEYTPEYLASVSAYGMTCRALQEDGYPLTKLNINSTIEAYNFAFSNANDLYLDAKGFVQMYTSDTQRDPAWLAANGCRAMGDMNHYDFTDYEYYVRTGIARTYLPEWTK